MVTGTIKCDLDPMERAMGGEMSTHVVLINVPTGILAEQLADLRKWLDQHSCELVLFTCKQHDNLVRMFLKFETAEETKQFRDAFYNNEVSHMGGMLLDDKLRSTTAFS